MDQATKNLNRLDMISCEWDEFSSDIPMNQLLKCSCRFLQSRVSDSGVAKALIDCISQYDDICDVSPHAALTGVIDHRWDRTSERFRPAFDLAKRLLQGVGHSLSSAETSTFVFLLDMNKVFEEYVKAILEAYFNVGIDTQKHVGWLFPELNRGKSSNVPIISGVRRMVCFGSVMQNTSIYQKTKKALLCLHKSRMRKMIPLHLLVKC